MYVLNYVTHLMRMVLFSLGLALGVPVAEADEAAMEIVGAPAKLEKPADVLVPVVAAVEPVGANAGVVAAEQTQSWQKLCLKHDML